jgi:hypothetical protein
VLARLRITEPGWGMPLQLWVQAARLGLRVKEVGVPRVYLDPTRAFGGVLDDADLRLAYYREVIARAEADEERTAVEATLTEAAKGGRAVASLEETLEAVGRGAVQRLFLLKNFQEPGRVCTSCGALQRGPAGACRLCGQPTEQRELGHAIVDRVLATGGRVDSLEAHDALARVGGVAALLRYPL